MSSSVQTSPNAAFPYRYRLFGLNVASELCLLQAERDFEEPDVTIRMRGTGRLPPEEDGEGPLRESRRGFARYFWPAIGWVDVLEGREIVLDPVPEAGPEILSHIVQGIALGTLLDQRGVFTLHASAVSIQGRAVAFLGWKGYGKSTICATLYGRGHPFVTDDVLALDGCGTGPVTVLPGTAQIKLYPDALEASLGEAADAHPQIWAPSPKRLRHVADGWDRALPLAAIYVLDFAAEEGAGVGIEPVAGHATFIELIRHSYMLRFFGQNGATPDHLARCSWLAHNVVVRRLVRPRDVNRVRESAEALERDVQNLGWAPAPIGPEAATSRTLITQ